MRLKDSQLSEGIPDVPILVNASASALQLRGGEVLDMIARPETLRTEATTMVWSNPPPDDTKLHPLIVLHQFGDGQCLTVGVPLETREVGNTWQRQLAINLVDRLLNRRVLVTNAPPGVEVVWNRQGARSIVHLINHQAGDPSRLSTARSKLVLEGIHVRLAQDKVGTFSNVRSLCPVSTVAYESEEDWLTLNVPSFAVHTALLVE